jgi:hypothetical protein
MRPLKNKYVAVAWLDAPPSVGLVVQVSVDQSAVARVFFPERGNIDTVNHDQIIHQFPSGVEQAIPTFNMDIRLTLK